MAARRPYVRPMAGWWRRNPYFVRYMAREVTSIFVAAYALLLLLGLLRLAAGRAEFEGWLALLRSPLSIAFHVLLFLVFAYHTFSWFAIMPKTLPPVVLAGRKLAAPLITTLGIGAALACSVALLGGLAWLAR